MQRRPRGFTLIELVIALLIGTILTSVALNTFNTAQTRMAVRSAKATYATLQARARAIGIETGANVAFVVDATGDSAYIETTAGVQEVIRFGQEMNIDLRAFPPGAANGFMLCMTPRGYADPDCFTASPNASLTPFVRLSFWQNADSTAIWVFPTGQLVEP